MTTQQSTTKPTQNPTPDIEQSVQQRYAAGARETEPALCCPTSYDSRYLQALPQEILDRDYGCGDPSADVGEGETVLDLGSGGGKICYILAQKVGASGNVIGVDFNDEMLALARCYQNQMGQTLGYDNVAFRKGRIQDLALDMERAEHSLQQNPVNNIDGWLAFEGECDRLRREAPMVEDQSVDVVVSNCVLNLVHPKHKSQLFQEMHRVLRRGGRAVISDIVCDEDPPEHIKNDPHLWSGCIAGAFREDQFLEMFEQAGFYGVEITKRQSEAWQTIEGIEFRSVTVRAYKGKEGPCWERNQAVIYKGPWKQVRDDDGHTFYRGQRMAVCDKTYHLMTDPNGPYGDAMIGIEPYETVPHEQAAAFNCKSNATRHPRQTKGHNYDLTAVNENGDCCEDEACC
jgi:SAM-dependent methyltransferase